MYASNYYETILSSAIGKIAGQTMLFNLGNRPKKKNLNSNQLYPTKKFTLCHILLVAEGLDKYISA